MADPSLRVLLDQNIPRAVRDWLMAAQPTWHVEHATDVGLAGAPDRDVLAWASDHQALVGRIYVLDRCVDRGDGNP